MFKKVKTRPKMTPEQEKAEREAVRLLKKAKRLLMEDDKNVEKAKKIRFEVTDQLLPQKQMYIIGKHPKSLLKEVDRKINNAYYRLNQQGMLSQVMPTSSSTLEKPVNGVYLAKDIDFAKINNAISNRYSKATSKARSEMGVSAGYLILLLLFVLILFFVMQNFYGMNQIYSSFNWLPR